MDLKAQLEALGLHKGASQLASRTPEVVSQRSRIEDLVPGSFVETENGVCFLAAQWHDMDCWHGSAALGHFLEQKPATFARLAKDAGIAGLSASDLVFVDTETTGLAGGAGTYAFLIGIGYFESERFVIEQYFMRDYAEEPAQLAALATTLDRFQAVVSFNGKAFDLPLIQTRLALARRPFRLASAPHLDLLFPARRIWQLSLPSCALSALETGVLGVQRTAEDVPGYLIPSLYFDYVRGGDAGPLAGVFYHNVQDILSLVTLSTLLCRIVDSPLEPSVSPLERLGVARMYEDSGMVDESAQAYQAALQGPLEREHETEVLRRLSFMLKRAGRRDEAAEIWQVMLDDAGDPPLFPYVELAKHYEWHTGQLDQAASVTTRALKLVACWRLTWERRRAAEELEHRLARLRRRMSGAASPDDAREE